MKLKPWVKTLFFLIILVIGGTFVYKGIQNYKTKDIIDEKVSALLKENNIPNSKYSKTLEFVLNNGLYDDLYLDEYINIEYSDKNNFKDVITQFLPKGYKGKEINYIMNLSDSNIDKLKELEYKDIKDYYKIKNFNVDNIERYNDYKKENNHELEDIVTRVNINLDIPVYTNTKETSDPDNLLVLVNKFNSLPKNYTPSDLTYLPGAYGNNVPMRKVLEESFLKLQEAAKDELGINLMPTTAFRNYSFQSTLYNNYVASDGKDKADTYSARPGYSEHQTGLAIDLKNTALNNIRLTDDNYKWLEENAHKYGFIIRFPKDKVDITLYQFENWHIRYVGNEVAKIIYDEDLSLEEYIDLYVIEY